VELDQRWPARVVAINWGPWKATGMVSPEVEREFARRGVALIGPEHGCRLMEEELRRGRKGEAEVVIGGLTAPAEHETLRTLDLRREPYLDDHRVDGRPVLPFAVAMELMAQAAQPHLDVAGLRQIRLLHGVTVDEQAGTAIRIVAAPRGDEVAVAITTPEGDRRHYSAIADAHAADPTAPIALDDLPPFPIDVEAAYRDLLFHGPEFQRITAVEGMDERGARARLQPSTGEDWLLDPILIDAALQMQVIWARLNWDVTLLPSEIGGYRRITAPPDGEVRHELRIRPDSRPPLCHADHWFYGADGRLVATLEDVVGVGTQALNRLTAGVA
jgi:hypothetical protein